MEKVSLVIPLKNEEKIVQRLINSIISQAVCPDEVIFVDAGSRDMTKSVVRGNAGKAPFSMKLVEMRNAHPGEARNAGIRESLHGLVAFTDGGIILGERWLEELMRPMEKDGSVDVVYGAFEPIADSFLKECSLIAYVPAREKIGEASFRTNSIASALFKKSACRKAGDFPDFRAAEDKVFMDNAKKAGAKISYTDKAVARWEIPGSIKGIFRRFAEFSAYDILAGRAGDWHYSVFRTYGIFLIFLLLAPAAGGIFLWGVPILWIMRIARIFFKKREDFRIKFILDPRYFFGIAFIILVTDIALFHGSLKYLRMRYGKNK